MTRRANTNLPPLLKEAEAYPSGTVALTTNQHHLRHIQRGFPLNDTRLSCHSSSFSMFFDHINAFHYYSLFLRESITHFSLFPLILATDNQYLVVFANLHL